MPDPRERTKDIYEEIPAYEKPPLIPLPDPNDVEALQFDLSGRKGRSLRFRLMHSILGALGFRKFHRNLSERELEDLLRKTDLRRLGQCAPAISATVNLADDPRDLAGIDRAVTLLIAARQLYREIREGTLPPDTFGGHPLEMGQYPNLFGTSIVWRGGRKPCVFKSTSTSAVNLAVGRRLYSLEIGALEADPTLESLRSSLLKVAERARRHPLGAEESSLGLLSSASPNTQRIAFPLMAMKAENRESLATLRHGLLTLCLDLDHCPESDEEAAHIAHSENLANRWHQSGLQLVVFGNGRACAIFKFDACIDGNTMMRGAAEIQKRASRLDTTSQPSEEKILPARELRCVISKIISRKAWKDVRSILDSQKATFEIKTVGRSFFKDHNLDTVPAFILALDMSIRHFTGHSGRIEQLLTMSKFRCMGLTTVLVSTPETVKFSAAMSSRQVERKEALAMMLAAIESQKNACRTARADLPFSQLIPLYLKTLRGPRKLIGLLFAVTRILLRIRWWSDVAVSHPAIFPEATMLGRPGVRLPYVNLFGLHYRILDETIIITMMPSLNWTISNAEFIAVLDKNLRRLKDIVKEQGNEN